MSRHAQTYVCRNCGAVSRKWSGRCDACGQWNTIEPEAVHASGAGANDRRRLPPEMQLEFQSLDGMTQENPRLATGNNEFDHVCGGGMASGSALLIGGEPGIGKSTLLLQITAGIARRGGRAVYISGEESVDQVRLRAQRLGVDNTSVLLAAATALDSIIDSLKSGKPDIVVIDSIQTLWSGTLPGAPGTVAQVRACAHELVQYVKGTGTVLVLVGHVTKDGQIAGPRVVEHLVDTVLYFESEQGRDYRILRSVKNRFGPAHEIGVFEMAPDGLREAPNPSELFLSREDAPACGVSVFAGVEGTRPVLVEIQALVTPSTLAAPRRAVVGWDAARLSMLLAVLDSSAGLGFGRHDVFLNVAGGLRINEPAADLAAAAALCSSLFNVLPVPDCVVFGEVALSGAVRRVNRSRTRLNEAVKLGFKRGLVPSGTHEDSLALTQAATLEDLAGWVRAGG